MPCPSFYKLPPHRREDFLLFAQRCFVLRQGVCLIAGTLTHEDGDVVLGTPTGVIFIPPHLVQEVVEQSEDIRLRDHFGKQRLREGRYTPGEIDRAWPSEIEADFQDWLKRQ